MLTSLSLFYWNEKYTYLYKTSKCPFIFSAIVEKYLLEKSRIVSQAKNER